MLSRPECIVPLALSFDLLGGIAKIPALPGFEVASSINFQISLMAVVAVEAKGREMAPPFLLLGYQAICSLSFFSS